MKQETAVVHVELQPDERVRLKVFAAQKRTSMAEIIRIRLSDIIENDEPETANQLGG